MKIWNFHTAGNPESVANIQSVLASGTQMFPKALAEILVQRGIENYEQARAFLAPKRSQLHDPMLLKDMEKAIDRVMVALVNEEPILIFGDYDVDGTTSVSLLQMFFQDAGFHFETYVPDRFSEGYGLSFQGIEYADETNCRLLIALDCGTKSIDKVRFANERNIDVVVVDHHQPGDQLPDVVAMINPLQPGCNYPDKVLSACGLTLKLCQGLALRMQEEGVGSLPNDYDPFDQFCDLAAVSTACDIVPLEGENRVIAHFGLEKFRSAAVPGLAALRNLYPEGKAWSISDIVFYVGPLINSAGRLDHATEAVQLLSARRGNLQHLAKQLQSANEARKLLDREVTDQADQLLQAKPDHQQLASTVLYDAAWSKGIIGIVASRLIERHYKPTVLLTKSGEYLVGSARSVSGFDLHAAIESCEQHLVQFGGHKYAAGLTMRPESLEAFESAFERYVKDNISAKQKLQELQIDTNIRLEEIDDKFVRLLLRLAPFGPSNPEPVFVASSVEVKEVNVLKGEHLKLLVSQDGMTFEAIGFYLAKQWEEVNSLRIDIAFQADFKFWKGKAYIQLKIKDFRRSA